MFFWWLFRKIFHNKVTSTDIRRILTKENFVFDTNDVKSLLEGNQKGIRFGAEIIKRKESNIEVDRYLKLVLSTCYRDWKSFRRQALLSQALASDMEHNIKTIHPVSQFSFYPTPYIVMEVRERGDDTYGFMDDTAKSYEGWESEDMEQLSQAILQFHQAGLRVGTDVLRQTRTFSVNFKEYERELIKSLEKYVEHHTEDGKVIRGKVVDILKKYMNIPDLEKQLLSRMKEDWQFVEESVIDGWYLVHADMQIDNIYKKKGGEFELFDLEWVGKTHSPLISTMFDYGNLRTRAWPSEDFRKLLDEQFLKASEKLFGNASWAKAALSLGLLRSSVQMARFHLDYKNTVTKDGHTEERYHAMYRSVLDSIESFLQKSTE